MGAFVSGMGAFVSGMGAFVSGMGAFVSEMARLCKWHDRRREAYGEPILAFSCYPTVSSGS